MHVRVCVECGEEYRPEIAVCADCGGALEDRHDDEAGPTPTRPVPGAAETEDAAGDAGFTEPVLHADRAALLTEAADRLVDAGVEFRLRPVGAPGEHASRYHLLVAEADRERALGVLGVSAGDRSGDCPACDTRLPAGAVECPECGLAAGDEPDPD
jgi:hypothetical protein